MDERKLLFKDKPKHIFQTCYLREKLKSKYTGYIHDKKILEKTVHNKEQG